MITRVCVSVCLCACVSVRGRMPTLLHGPGCNLGSGRDASLVVHYWVGLQSGHGLRCYGMATTRTRNVSEYMLVLAVCLVNLLFIFFFIHIYTSAIAPMPEKRQPPPMTISVLWHSAVTTTTANGRQPMTSYLHFT